jgi:hypothetical protein
MYRTETTSFAVALTWLGLKPTPLRRPHDRIEVAARWVALAGLVASVLLAALVAGSVAQHLSAQAARYERLPTATATLLEDATTSMSAPMAEPSMAYRALAEWVTPNDRLRRGAVSVALTARRGDQVEVRLLRDGTPVRSRPSALGTAVLSGIAGAAVVAGAGALGCFGTTFVGTMLQRRRDRYWEAAWDEFDHARNSRTS